MNLWRENRGSSSTEWNFHYFGNLIHPIGGFALAIIVVFGVFSIISAAQTIFVSAIYHNINGDIIEHFDQQMVDDLFTRKSKWLN